MATATKTRSKTTTTKTKPENRKARKASKSVPGTPVSLVVTKVGANVVDASGAFLARCTRVEAAKLLVASLNQAQATPAAKQPVKVKTKAPTNEPVFDLDDTVEDAFFEDEEGNVVRSWVQDGEAVEEVVIRRQDRQRTPGMYGEFDDGEALSTNESAEIFAESVGSREQQEFTRRLTEGEVEAPLFWKPELLTIHGETDRGSQQMLYNVALKSLELRSANKRRVHVHPKALAAFTKVLRALELE